MVTETKRNDPIVIWENTPVILTTNDRAEILEKIHVRFGEEPSKYKARVT